MNLSDALTHPIFNQVAHAADELQQKVYVVGGYVRDFLLERDYQKDIDFVTIGDGVALAKKVAESIHPSPKVSVYENFGTAAFHYDGISIEFVGARKESYSESSRKPKVSVGTLEDDQLRRDFTINALAISLQKEDFGRVLDPFGGLADLHNKIIRTPNQPDITFSDDPLRSMRAIRFATQLKFTIEPNTIEGIKKNAYRLRIVSQERITDELNKIMLSEKPSFGFYLMDEVGILEMILPEIVHLKGIEEIEGKTHKDNFHHTLEVLDNISAETDNLWLRWAALLHDIGKPVTKKFIPEIGWTFHSHEYVGSKMVKTIFKRLRLPLHKELEKVELLVRMSSRPAALVDDGVTDSALRRLLFEAGDSLEDLFLLCKADITTKNDIRKQRYKKNFEKVEQRIREVEERDRIKNFQPPISGEEIMETFQLKPGKMVGLIKEQIKEAILDGVIPNSYEEAKKFMLKKGKQLFLEAKNQ